MISSNRQRASCAIFGFSKSSLYFGQQGSVKKTITDEWGWKHTRYSYYIDRDVLRGLVDFLNRKPTLEEFIVKILMTSENYYSLLLIKNPENCRVQASPLRNRSALDIWRHVKVFAPDISIFSVMECLYNIFLPKPSNFPIYERYCTVVRKRVFNRALMPDHNQHSIITCKYVYDEFGLQFSHWKNIESEEEKLIRLKYFSSGTLDK